jgi:hypothetical protein
VFHALHVQVSTIYRQGMLEQPAPPAPQPPLVDGTGETEVEMEVEDATAGTGGGGGEGPPAILGQLLEGGVSPVELARLAQSGRRQRLGACPSVYQLIIVVIMDASASASTASTGLLRLCDVHLNPSHLFNVAQRRNPWCPRHYRRQKQQHKQEERGDR